jgi:sodium-dependent dicarboxylate transporter 2/3/5
LESGKVGLSSGFILGGFILLYQPFPSLDYGATVVLATTVLMAVWWLTEALPIYATALIPLGVFPLLGVRTAGNVSVNYMDPNIVLFMGGFFLAMAIQKWDLHRRIALAIIVALGNSFSQLILGFMVATAVLSMWVSNTATAVMMFPIGTAVATELETQGMQDRQFPVILLLSIA